MKSAVLIVGLALAAMGAAPFPYRDMTGPRPAAHDADGDGDIDLADVAAYERAVTRADYDSSLATLRTLPRLPKTHYCWPVERDQLVARDPLLAEYVRITGSLGIRGAWGATGTDELRAAVELCAPHGATIAINYSPWHNTYEGENIDPRSTGPEVARAFAIYREQLEAVKGRLKRANAALSADVRVAVLLLDTEIFVVKPDDDPGAKEWNAAIDAKLNPFYTIGKELFPDVPVRWYDRGTTLGRYKRFTGRELGDGYSTSLYATNDLARTRSHYRWSVNRSPDGKSMPWVALGCGFFWEGGRRSDWMKNRPYDVCISRQLGAEINRPEYGDNPDGFAPWHAAETVMFFPHPFCPTYPYWAEHFIAYVRGATE